MPVWLKSNVFKKYLAVNDISAKEFCKVNGFVDNHLSNIINKKASPGEKIRKRLQKVTGMKWDELFEFAEEEK